MPCKLPAVVAGPFCCADSSVSFLSSNSVSAAVLCACGACCCLTSLRVVAVAYIYIYVSVCVCLLCKMRGRLGEIFEFSPSTFRLARASFRFSAFAKLSSSTVSCPFVNQSRCQFAEFIFA